MQNVEDAGAQRHNVRTLDAGAARHAVDTTKKQTSSRSSTLLAPSSGSQTLRRQCTPKLCTDLVAREDENLQALRGVLLGEGGEVGVAALRVAAARCDVCNQQRFACSNKGRQRAAQRMAKRRRNRAMGRGWRRDGDAMDEGCADAPPAGFSSSRPAELRA